MKIKHYNFLLIFISLFLFFSCEKECSTKCEDWESCNTEYDICEVKNGQCNTNSDCDSKKCDKITHKCELNVCLPNPCKESHKKKCKATSNTFECLCNTGYKLEGEQCVRICKSDSCTKENQTCKATGDTFECICKEGFELLGESCVVICGNNATYNEENKKCMCNIGYNEKNGKCIDNGKPACDKNPCDPNIFVSKCISDFTITRCMKQIENKDCFTVKEDTCLGFTKCQENNNIASCVHNSCLEICDPNNFVPNCDNNIAKKSCSSFNEERGFCKRIRCSLNGTCVTDNNTTERCECHAGYVLSENKLNCIKGDLNPCDENPCDGNKICQTKYGDRKCIQNDDREYCENINCSSNGICVTDNNTTERCECNKGYVLSKNKLNCIKRESDPCEDDNPCGENEVCQFELGATRCVKSFTCNTPKTEKCLGNQICKMVQEEPICTMECVDSCTVENLILGCSEDNKKRITGCKEKINGCMEFVYTDCPENTHCQLGHLKDASLCIPDDADGCHDNIDNDNDGWIDSEDPDCNNGGSLERGFSAKQCNDNRDNDRDGKVDSEDADCIDGNDSLELN